MKNIFKSVLPVIFLAAFVLVACGGAPATTAATEAPASDFPSTPIPDNNYDFKIAFTQSGDILGNGTNLKGWEWEVENTGSVVFTTATLYSKSGENLGGFTPKIMTSRVASLSPLDGSFIRLFDGTKYLAAKSDGFYFYYQKEVKK